MKNVYFLFLIVFMLFDKGIAQNQWVWYTPNNSGLPGWTVNEMVIDSTNTKWFATENGLARLKGNTWTVWDTNNSPLTHNFLVSIAKDKENKLWVATRSKGIFKFDGSNWIKYYNTNLYQPFVSVTRIRVDNNNTVWVCDAALGLTKYLRELKKWIRYSTNNSPLPDNFVNDVQFEGNIKWIGTVHSGVARYDDTSWTIYDNSNTPLISNFIEGIGIDKFKNKWFCTRFGGVAKYNTLQNQWTIYTSTNSGLYWNNTWTIFFDFNNVKWIGLQDHGFVRYDDKIWTLMHDSTYYHGALDFKNDKYGNLWICETYGIYIYNPNGVVSISNNNHIENQTNNIEQIYPNPFNSSTRIEYSIKKSSFVKIIIYDTKGSQVEEIYSGYKQEGNYSQNYVANNLSSGIYFYSLIINDKIADTKKFVLLK